MKNWIRGILAVLFMLGIVAAATWVVRRNRPPGAVTILESQAMDMRAMKPPIGRMPVATAEVQSGSFEPSVTYSGTVVAQGDQEITARVTGVLLEVLVYPGERVVEGQLLARLDSAELSSRVEEARAALTESQQLVRAREAEWSTKRSDARAVALEVPVARTQVAEAGATSRAAGVALETVQAEFARSQILHGQGALSLEELQQDRAKLAEAQAERKTNLQRYARADLQVSLAQAQLRARQSETEAARRNIETGLAAQQRSQAQLGTAAVQLGYTQIRAISPGEVTERLVSPGTLVMPGQVLLRLKQAGRVRLQALVPVEQALRIRTGFPVKARVNGKLIQGRVSSIFRSADAQTRTMVVEALVPPDRENLVPGAYLSMEIAVSAPITRLSIPLGALQKDAEGVAFVWKLGGEKKAAATIYTCVMHPEVRLPAPGKCPKCGMQLVPEKPTGESVARRQTITPGPVAGERLSVLKGLKAGDRVIVEGYQDLADGMSVNAVKWGQDGPLELPAPAPPVPGAAPEGQKADPHANH